MEVTVRGQRYYASPARMFQCPWARCGSHQAALCREYPERWGLSVVISGPFIERYHGGNATGAGEHGSTRELGGFLLCTQGLPQFPQRTRSSMCRPRPGTAMGPAGLGVDRLIAGVNVHSFSSSYSRSARASCKTPHHMKGGKQVARQEGLSELCYMPCA
jgi:hypothetical protein